MYLYQHKQVFQLCQSLNLLPCRVPNAHPGKDSVNIEIFGMAGVPEGAVPGGAAPPGMLQKIALRHNKSHQS